ncbi:sorting nexin-21 isoform X1 [Anopheles arabiensis]|nr:sorting nexin-21 isoform X1 [Anopheles arabiensis]XP_040172047.1 sorting nexin-21 isoform X1 [Anopheles arabiensis]XP_040172048.1 sorting nexin-21 isoform X1 [Anopheles arabiensis]XP_040236572.2 sorting nexin-21 isoform X1 [Anopheles coluzzii]XP_061518866.1 sorting nexin-21 isoform X1 [Anopheles gambiae]
MHPVVVGRRMAMENGTESIEDDLDSSATEAFDQSTLSMKQQTKGTVQDIWQRPTRRPLPNAGDVVLCFEIPLARILPTGSAASDGQPVSAAAGKKYVIYEVNVRKDGPGPDPYPTSVERRYTHFLKLYEGLRKDQPAQLQTVCFPKKVLMGNFTAELIGERSAAFECFLDHIVTVPSLRDSPHFLEFLQGDELRNACQLLDERRNELAVPLLENCFRLLNKIFLDKSKCVLLLLCRLVAACTTSPIPHPSAEQWAELALRRYEHVCDTELLVLYIPLLQTCLHLWWQRGRDRTLLEERLSEMGKKGIKVKGGPTLAQAIHALDPRAETI